MVVQTFSCSVDDLDDEGELGRGAYGSVSRMRHRTTKTIMAVKVRKQAKNWWWLGGSLFVSSKSNHFFLLVAVLR